MSRTMSGISNTGDAKLDADNDFTPPNENIFRDKTIFREAGESSEVGINVNATTTQNQIEFRSNADTDDNILTLGLGAKGVIRLLGDNSEINLDGAGSKIIFADNTEMTTADTSLPKVYYNNYTVRASQNVSGGNPDGDDPNNKGGLLSGFNATATVTATDSGNACFRISGQVFGEWNGAAHNKGMAIARRRIPVGGGTEFQVILRPPIVNGRIAVLTHFVIGFHNNALTTPESAIITPYHDSFAADVGDTIKYEFVLINTEPSNTRNFTINGTVSNSSGLEAGESWISAMEVDK